MSPQERWNKRHPEKMKIYKARNRKAHAKRNRIVSKRRYKRIMKIYHMYLNHELVPAKAK